MGTIFATNLLMLHYVYNEVNHVHNNKVINTLTKLKQVLNVWKKKN